MPWVWPMPADAGRVATLEAHMSSVEEWRSVVGFEGDYMVSNLGRVKGLPRTSMQGRPLAGGVMSPSTNWAGYMRLTLFSSGKPMYLTVHRLVCVAFHGPPPSPKHEVAHGDGVRDNNRADNLRWATHAENIADRVRHGTVTRTSGETHGHSVLTNDMVLAMRSSAASGARFSDLATAYGVNPSTVSRIVRRLRWTHI